MHYLTIYAGHDVELVWQPRVRAKSYTNRSPLSTKEKFWKLFAVSCWSSFSSQTSCSL